ncbi:MAG: branched-chain amino acid ABC transporter permease, partial [Chloroflexi bacterium]|nr:branched-chain amino acid ABC transporter permease [Chloroflexota bacterium]
LLFLAMVIVGGLASVWGALAGAIILEIVSEEAANSGGLSDAIIGAVVVLMLLLAPRGLAALPRRLARFITSRRPVADPVAGKVSA